MALSKEVATQERLLELLNYCPKTGRLTWRVNHGNRRVGQQAGTHSKINGYRHISIDGVYYKEHRLIWMYVNGEWPKDQIDHINRKRDDNRIQNLRESSQTENMANGSLQSNNTSGYRGVSFNKGVRKWEAYIRKDRKRTNLGVFTKKAHAAIAYNAAAKVLFGEFAFQNDILPKEDK